MAQLLRIYLSPSSYLRGSSLRAVCRLCLFHETHVTAILPSLSGASDMLKRLFQAPLPASTQLPASDGASNRQAKNFPQHSQVADQHQLAQLSGHQGDSNSHTSQSQNNHTQSNYQHKTQNTPYASTRTDALCPSAPMVSQQVLQVAQLQQRLQQQQQLHQVERKLGQTLNFSTIAGTTVVETAALFDAEQVNLLRYDGNSQTCQQIVRYCQNQTLAWQRAFSISEAEFPILLQQLWQGKIVRIAAGKANTTAHNNSPNRVPHHEMQQWLTSWPGSWLLLPVPKSQTAQLMQSLPADDQNALVSGNISSDNMSYWGVMALALPEHERWTDEAAIAASSVITTLTAAMGHAQQYQELMVANKELQKLALSDGLTCLANRRRFDEHLADEWQRLARDKKPLSLILCDLDHFKKYNDTFGHPAGDRCLIRVARALLSGPQRPADLVARYGGEEFAIILPNTDTHGAWRIAQKVHDSIRALQIDHAPDNEEPYVTVTMGVSTVIPGHDNTPQMLVQASDLALYHAKQQGRNRTYVNGHYNTVNEDEVMDTGLESANHLDVMPLDSNE